MEPPKHSDDITEIQVERDVHASSPVGHDIELSSRPASHSSNLPSASEMVIQEPGQQQSVALPELSPERPRIGARPIRETALPATTIRPALAESHTLVNFPRVPSNSSLTPSAQLPIHVRIGRVEVRATTASTPTPARPSSPAPVGFDAYYRIRNYRS